MVKVTFLLDGLDGYFYAIKRNYANKKLNKEIKLKIKIFIIFSIYYISFRKGGVEVEAKTGLSLVQEWEEFNQLMKAEKSIRPVRLQSWEKRGCPYFMSVEDLDQKQFFNNKLIRAAKPYMDQLSMSFYGKQIGRAHV